MSVAWYFKYPLLFIGTIFEGPIVMVASGFLLHFGIFEPIPLFIVLGAGDITADILWYFLGYHYVEPLIKKRGHFLSITPELFEKGKILFQRYHEKILIISKLTLGFGMAIVILTVAGASKVPFKTYMLLNILGEVVVVSVLLIVGYFVGNIYSYISDSFKIIFLAGMFIILIAVLFGFSRYIKSIIVKK